MEGPQRLTRRAGAGAIVVVAAAASTACTLVGSGAGPERPATVPATAATYADAGRATGPAAAERRPEAPSRGGNMERYRQSGGTYRVLDTSYGYDERGVASWYGEYFHGRPTSSGEPYDMYALSAAHRTLPLPSWVEVTNLANGRRVVLRVNDRGPFHDPERRIIDVSYAAAVQLGMDRTGTAAVRVRAVEPWQIREGASRRR